jgi:hypothetical protein
MAISKGDAIAGSQAWLDIALGWRCKTSGAAMTLPEGQITRLEPAMSIMDRLRREAYATPEEQAIMGDVEARREAYAMVKAALKRLGIE